MAFQVADRGYDWTRTRVLFPQEKFLRQKRKKKRVFIIAFLQKRKKLGKRNLFETSFQQRISFPLGLSGVLVGPHLIPNGEVHTDLDASTDPKLRRCLTYHKIHGLEHVSGSHQKDCQDTAKENPINFTDFLQQMVMVSIYVEFFSFSNLMPCVERFLRLRTNCGTANMASIN